MYICKSSINAQPMYLGIDIGGTTAKIGVVNPTNKNEIIEKQCFKSADYPTANALLNKTASIADALLTQYNITSIGIGVPGIVQNGMVLLSPNLEWTNIKIEEYFRKHYTLPIAVDNDANAAAYAELVDGAGKEMSHFIYVTLGTGVGGAIIIDRKIYRGMHGGAGEIGHSLAIGYKLGDKEQKDIDVAIPQPSILDFHNPLAYRSDTLEERIGSSAILKFAKCNYHNFEETKSISDLVALSEDIERGSAAAIEVMSCIGFALGRSLASLANVFDITNFIIGGGISNMTHLLDRTKDVTKKYVMPHLKDSINIVQAKFMSDTGIIGAALLGEHFR